MLFTHLLYLHGFRSSPQSAKAVRMAARVAAAQAAGRRLQWWCPQLPPSPREAIDMLLAGVADWPHAQMAVIGSSLGGYYASVLAERLGCAAVVLNPAVDPARDLARYIGEIQAWHSEERFYFRAAYIDELRAMHPGPLTHMERYCAVVAQGDEVLDWREMVARHAGADLLLLEGGDHALSDFDRHEPHIHRFLGLDTPAPADT